MRRDEVMERLRGMMAQLRPGADISAVGEDTRLREDLGMDSLSMLIMALQAEKTFGIRFENMSAAAFATVGDVCAYIEKKM